MQLTFRDVFCVTLLCLASLTITRADMPDVPQLRRQAKAFCLYDGQIHFDSAGQVSRFISKNDAGCVESYAYQFNSRVNTR